MNGYAAHKCLISSLKETYAMGGGKVLIIKYLYHLRKYAYYYNNHKKLFSWSTVMMAYEHYMVALLGVKCGFSIGQNALGYGVVIPHYGTIVVNENAQIGNFAVLHTCTCIAGGDKIIGDGLYLSTGSQIVGPVRLGKGVTVAAHSLVNKSFGNNVLVAGTPCSIKKENQPAWYESERDKDRFLGYLGKIEKIRKQIYG